MWLRKVTRLTLLACVVVSLWTVFSGQYIRTPIHEGPESTGYDPPGKVMTMTGSPQEEREILSNVSVNSEEAKTGRGSLPDTVIPEETCSKPIARPKEYPLQDVPRDTWQECEPGQSYVYSAYIDRRQGSKGKIIVYSLRADPIMTRPPSSLRCRLWFPGKLQPRLASASTTRFSEWGQTRFTCHLEQGEPMPYALSVVRTTCESALNTIYVHDMQQEYSSRPQHQFTICVPTMYGNYNNFRELVEMVEVNRMFGVDNIVLYNYSTGADIQPYFRSYQRENKVDIIQWDLPDVIAQSKGVHNHGLVTCINDCIYRYMYRTKFLAVADLDELIVPRKHRNWAEMVDPFVDRQPGHPLIPGALIFKCTFFRKEMRDPEMERNSTIKELDIRTMLNTKREVKIWPHLQRSKYITDPKFVDMAGVHFVHFFLTNKISRMKNHGIAPDLGLLHHYRLWEDPPSGAPPVEKDDFLHQYRQEILNRVRQRHELVTSISDNRLT